MNDEDFFKELESVTNEIQKENELNKNSTTNNIISINNDKITTNNHENQDMTFLNKSLSEQNDMNFGNMFKNMNFGNEGENLDNLKKMFSQMVDGSDKDLLEKINQGFNEVQTMLKQGSGTDNVMGVNNQNQSSNQKFESNPFSEAFKDMNKPDGVHPNFFDAFNGKNMEDFNFGDQSEGMLKNLYSVLTKLSNSTSANPADKDNLNNDNLDVLFESLYEILIKEDLSTPLLQIKDTVNKYIAKNQDKLNSEKKIQYQEIISNVDSILVELKRAEPDKKLIIASFKKLHELSALESEIFGEDDMFSNLGGLMGGFNFQGNGNGKENTDLKDLADKFFK